MSKLPTTVKYDGVFQDVRRRIQHVALVFGLLQDRSTAAFECYRILVSFLDNGIKGMFYTFGYIWNNCRYEPTRDTRKHHRVAQALDYIITNVLRLPRVLSVSLGKAVKIFPAVANADRSLLIWWHRMSMEPPGLCPTTKKKAAIP